MAGRIAAKLKELGIELPTPFAPIANYVPFVVSGKLVTISGQVPVLDGKITTRGKLGGSVTTEAGKAAARQCMINVLAQVRLAVGGDLDRVQRVVRLGGFIASTPDFTAQSEVMNGASDLAVAVFGEAGRHARSTVGVAALPLDCTVEVEGIFEIA